MKSITHLIISLFVVGQIVLESVAVAVAIVAAAGV